MQKILEQLRHEARGIRNPTAHFMGLAEKYIAEGNLEFAKACLILLCENCSNYEESIAWNGLAEKWQKYRHLVDGLVPASVKFHTNSPCLPTECTMQINDILSLPDDDILSALSEHLGELSGNGEQPGCLNKWERIIYYADELCMEVNSGGFDSYLYYHGLHFEKAFNALEIISAFGVLRILNSIREKFPKNRIPISEKSLQKTMESMEDRGICFEREDELFYSTGEKELLTCLLSYVKENKKHLR